MPFDITVARDFAAAHQLRLGDGALEPLHGHNWRVAVTASADALDAIGTVMDFHDLRRRIDAIVDPMHNAHLNDLPAFAVDRGGLNPSAEHVALHVGRSLALPDGVRVSAVTVWETADCAATYRL